MIKTELAFNNKINDAEFIKLLDVCEFLGFHPNWLMGVMNFESGINTKATNPVSGSVGVIQFTRDKAGVNYKTINGKQYLLSDIKNMTLVQQLDLVKAYYKPFANQITSFEELYLCTFFPAALNKTNDYVLQSAGLSAQLIAQQNKIFDLNDNNQLTRGEIIQYFNDKYVKVYPSLSATYMLGEIVINSDQRKCKYCGHIILAIIGFFFTYTVTVI